MRTKKALLNFFTSFFPWLILAIMGFLKIRLFIQHFGPDMNGLVQLVSQVYAYLALMEFGFGSAIIYKLYKPFADGDRKKISELFTGAKKIYRLIGLLMLVAGVVISFIAPFCINNLTISKSYVVIIFLLFSIDYFTLYFFGLSYQTLLTADQNQYKINIIQNVRAIIFKTIELVLIIYNVNLILILLFGIVSNIISNIVIIRIAKKKYPWLDKKAKPDKEPLKMTKDVVVHKLSGLVYTKTDSIILAIFSGLSMVSIYGAYNYIISSINTIISFIFSSLKDGFGNLYATDNIEDNRKGSSFSEILFLSFYIAIIIIPIFNVSVIQFVKIWIDKTYAVNYSIIIIFSIYLWYLIISKPLVVIRNANGLYKESKWYTLLQTIVNLALSLLLVSKYGIFGVLLATIISQIFVSHPFEVRLVYKKILQRKIKSYIKLFFINLALLILMLVLDFGIINALGFYNKLNVLSWFIETFIIGIINLAIVTTIFYCFTTTFRLIIKRFYNLIVKKKQNQ